jgi:endonuclease-3
MERKGRRFTAANRRLLDNRESGAYVAVVAQRRAVNPKLKRRGVQFGSHGKQGRAAATTLSIEGIVESLETAYGPRPWRKHRAGVDGLVQTILSQNTTDANSSAAFRALRSRFPTWEQVLDAPVREIEQAIRSAGLSRLKAPRIKAALRRIKSDRGHLSLAFLARLPLGEARDYLQHIDGVGPKTAACVLMFCYNRPALPVDTHVHRVARRLGLIPDGCTAEAAHDLLQQMCPPRLIYPFHVLMVAHGRRTCRARTPQCDACVLADHCRWRRLPAARPAAARPR